VSSGGCGAATAPGALAEEEGHRRRSPADKGYEASLEIGKLYRVLPDEQAEDHGYLRIVDESGDDYGYEAKRFFAIEVPKPLQKALLKAAS
jgi:hypothetical protein